MASGTTTHIKFVSEKIRKVKWQQTGKQIVQKSNIFASGSWDDAINHIGVWSVQPPVKEQNQEEVSLGTPAGEPVLVCSTPHAGDVMDLQFVAEELILAASSTGCVKSYRYHGSLQTIKENHKWEGLHHYGGKSKATCTGIDTRGEEAIVSVGEDGKINVLSFKQKAPIQTIEQADSCSLNAVKFLKQQEVATVNSTGQLKVWDLREGTNEAARTFLLTGERVPLHCVDRHPTQPHIVATGGQDGMLCVWDMRQDKFPVTLLDAHGADMWEVKFHPTHPDNLFTCSEDGEVWHWDGSNMGANPAVTSGQSNFPSSTSTAMSISLQGGNKASQNYTSPWLISDTAKHRLEITNMLPGNVMPVNSLDILDTTLVCGTDGEAVYVQHDIVIR